MATRDDKINGQVCLICLAELFGSESTNCDLNLYQRFLHFNNGYFELGPVVDKFLKGVEELALAVSQSNADVVGDTSTSSQAPVVVVKAFCTKCKDWVADLCDLYDQLLETVTKAEAILTSKPWGQKSSAKAQDAWNSLSEQLNVKEWKEVESFRQTLLSKCKEKSGGNFSYETTKEFQVKLEPIDIDVFFKSGDSENGDGTFHEDNFTIQTTELQEGRRRSTRVRTQKRKFVLDSEDDFDDDNDLINTKKEAESDSDWSDAGAALPVDCDNYFSEHSDVNDDVNEDIDSLPENVSSQCLPFKKKRSKMKRLRSSSKISDEDTQETSDTKEAKKDAGASMKEEVDEKKGTYMCPKCPEKVPNKEKLSEHLYTAHKVSPDAHFCEMCGKEFDTYAILIHHKRRNHEIGKNGILTLEERQCYICDGIFLKPSHRKRHLIRVHHITNFKTPIKKSKGTSLTPKPKDRSCRCRQCNQKLPTPAEFRRHLLANKHDHVVLCCPTCPKIFTEQEALQGHLEVHETMTEPYFYCESCAVTFIQEKFLQNHMKNVHNNKFVCNQCNTKLKTPKELRRHLETHETDKKTHRCVYCAREFSGQQYYDIHRKVVHCDKRKRFYCDMEKCGEDVETVEELHEHMQEHVREKEGTRIFNCDTCKQGFFNELSATLHKLLHVPPNDKENSDFGFTCPECAKPLTYKHSLFLHYQRCHMKSVSCHFSSSDLQKTHFHNKYEYDETWPIPCYFCHERFLTKERLEVHIKERKGHGRRMAIGFVCDSEECTEKCGSISELDDHLKSHSKGQNEIHRCTFCSWPFLSEGRLELHQLEHSKKGDSGFECPKCDQVFGTQAHLVGHYKRYHAKVKTFINCSNCGTNFRTLTRFNEHTTQECQDFASGKSCLTEFACTFEGCQKTFYAKGSLVAHLNNTHATSKNFVCDICGAAFPFRGLLKEHGICHQEKKYECPICHKKFARKNAVIKHKPIHDPDRPAAFVCSICGASFKTESGMRYHTTAIHTQVEKKIFTCQHPNCSKSYRRRSVLTKHVKKCHPKDETGNLSRIGGRDEGIPSGIL